MNVRVSLKLIASTVVEAESVEAVRAAMSDPTTSEAAEHLNIEVVDALHEAIRDLRVQDADWEDLSFEADPDQTPF